MINAYNYFDFVEKKFCGHALTGEYLNQAITEIINFFIDGGAYELSKRLGLIVRERWQGEYLLTRRICFSDGTELSLKQIKLLGAYLPCGKLNDNSDISIIRGCA